MARGRTSAQGRNRTRNQTRFATIPPTRVPRSAFDRSHGLKTTFDEGLLIPISVDEMLPGDTLAVNTFAFMRMATPLHPVMDNLFLDVHWWFCPSRLLFDNWQRFMGGKESPDDPTEFIMPQIVGTHAELSLGDYFGLPINVQLGDGNNACSSLPFRAYNRIWDEWYRDQNLQESPVLKTGNASDTPAEYPLLPRGKRKDMFTSALPWPQKGPPVDLPIGGQAPLVGESRISGFQTPTFKDFTGTRTGRTLNSEGDRAPQDEFSGNIKTQFANQEVGGALNWDVPGLKAELGFGVGQQAPAYADLSQATGASVNAFRLAFQIQRMYERDARGGNARYSEVIRSHFGVISPDQRLQRPEFLHSNTIRFNVNPVAQTSTTETQPTPQGNLAAFSVAAGGDRGFIKSFTEHGFVIALASIRGELQYQQGLDRMWSRRTRFDHYWPSFAFLGEQPVYNREIYCDGTADDTEVFGYQERYAEYRYRPSKITGKMRSTAAQSLDTWHLGYHFTERPVLNDSFIQEAPPVSRVVAVPSEPRFLGDFWFNVRHVRPMPSNGVPGLIDHF